MSMQRMVLEGGLKHHVLCCGWAFDLQQVGQLKPSPMHGSFEGKTERLCYVAMLQKQVPKFPKMSTLMNLAVRRRAPIRKLGNEPTVEFLWSGRLGADSQFVLFVRVYDNEGYKAKALCPKTPVQDLSHQAPNLLKLPAIRNLTCLVSHACQQLKVLSAPPNLQPEATCQ